MWNEPTHLPRPNRVFVSHSHYALSCFLLCIICCTMALTKYVKIVNRLLLLCTWQKVSVNEPSQKCETRTVNYHTLSTSRHPLDGSTTCWTRNRILLWFRCRIFTYFLTKHLYGWVWIEQSNTAYLELILHRLLNDTICCIAVVWRWFRVLFTGCPWRQTNYYTIHW